MDMGFLPKDKIGRGGGKEAKRKLKDMNVEKGRKTYIKGENDEKNYYRFLKPSELPSS